MLTLRLDRIGNELSISCLTLSGHLVPFGHSLIPYIIQDYIYDHLTALFCCFVELVALLAEIVSWLSETGEGEPQGH